VDTEAQRADVFTKVLDGSSFAYNVDHLMIWVAE
jgi:hypothetical protein